MKQIFSIAANENFGKSDQEVITDEEVNESLLHPQAIVYNIYIKDEKVAGVILKIDEVSQRNSLDILFVYPTTHSKGLGTKIWFEIEKMYPDTKVWELVTPYFEKRNIHFYVNKLGFKIVEFFNEYHTDQKMQR